MIKIQGKIPRKVGVAVSGGVDSMAALDFLRRNHDVRVYHYNHNTEYGQTAMSLVVDYCHKHTIPFVIEYLHKEKPRGKSWEEFWRDERYAFLNSQEDTIVLAHHLDDCVETYAFNMCHGKEHTVPYRRANCIRPFRLTRKQDLVEWGHTNKVQWLDDPTNLDPESKYMRAHIRSSVVPAMLKVNPGLHKVIYKKLKDEPLNIQDD